MSLRRDIQELEYLTEEIIRYERENGTEMGEAFESYEEALNWLYSSIEGTPEYQLDHSDQQDVFELIKRTGLHKTDRKENLWKLEKRLQEYSERGFDDMELIVRYRLEAEELGKTPSARDARSSDHMPTQTAYLGDGKEDMHFWSDVKWRAGFEGHQKLGKDLLLEKLNDTIHRINNGRSLDEYDIPKGPDLEDIESAPSSKSFRGREDIGSYEEALRILGFQRIREKNNENSTKWKAGEKFSTGNSEELKSSSD